VAMVLGVPLIPQRPDEASAEGAAEAGTEPPPESAQASEPEEPPARGTPMMVFGPMLAISALEFLFFGEHITLWLTERFSF
jgi:hypothetical protein